MAETLPLLHSLTDSFNRLGIGRSKGYEEIAAGRLRVIKIGRRSLIAETELQRYVASLTEASAR
ncbi:excisionase family DNA-binding protein [Tessaracoccus sp. Y1736]